MNGKEAEVIDELLLSGYRLYETFPRWKVYSRRNTELIHYYFNGLGLEFVTVFKNGRTAKGYYHP